MFSSLNSLRRKFWNTFRPAGKIFGQPPISLDQGGNCQWLTCTFHQLVKAFAPAADFLQCGSVMYK